MGNIQVQDVTNTNAPNNVNLPEPQSANQTVTTTPPSNVLTFPYPNSVSRLSDYDYFNNLLLGQHFEAFNIRIGSGDYTANYSKLRYVAVNFAGLLSRIMADMLFSEPIYVKCGEANEGKEDNSTETEEDSDQDWVDSFCEENRLNEQLYESAVSNSGLGDALFKLRIGKRYPSDKNPTIILEEFTPTIYFPHLDGFNVRALPQEIELAWTFKVNDKKYLRQEIHKPTDTTVMIEHHVYEMKENNIMNEVDLEILGDPSLKGVGMTQDTKIDRYMIVHIPNWKAGNRHFGLSDYYDLDKLFYAINNRITKIDNILDKHSDPILMVPDGVLDENGKVSREALHMLEVPEGAGNKQKPEYIVWNASLDNAINEIDKLINVFMMTGEITPDILGMGQGMNDSGRALKFKLMRTIAKGERKKLYYDRGIKEIVYVAQLLAKAWEDEGVTVGKDELKLKGEPKVPDIDWQDGLPIDDYEEVTNEIAKIDAGIQTKKQAIMNLDGLDERAAEGKLEEIKEEGDVEVPAMTNDVAQFDNNGQAIQPKDNPIATPPVNAKAPGTAVKKQVQNRTAKK